MNEYKLKFDVLKAQIKYYDLEMISIEKYEESLIEISSMLENANTLDEIKDVIEYLGFEFEDFI